MSYTFTVPLQVGDKVYTRLILDGELLQEELAVTEVCSKGFFVSSYNPPENDLGDFIPYTELGRTYFMDANLLIERGEVTDHE